MLEWQLLGTAQKDGRAHLLICDSWITVGFWHRTRKRWTCEAPGYPDYPADEQPTHYQDLPEPLNAD